MAFVCFNRIYFYLYQFPVIWNSSFTELHISKPVVPKLIPYLFVNVLMITYSMTAFAIAFFHTRLLLGVKLEVVDVIVIFLSGFSVAVVCFVSSLLASLLVQFNSLLKLVGNLLNGKTLICTFMSETISMLHALNLILQMFRNRYIRKIGPTFLF